MKRFDQDGVHQQVALSVAQALQHRLGKLQGLFVVTRSLALHVGDSGRQISALKPITTSSSWCCRASSDPEKSTTQVVEPGVAKLRDGRICRERRAFRATSLQAMQSRCCPW